jgi:hypothetical protein
MCEPPAIKRIDFYCHSDLSLAGFIVAAAPHAQKKCQVRAVLLLLHVRMPWHVRLTALYILLGCLDVASACSDKRNMQWVSSLCVRPIRFSISAAAAAVILLVAGYWVWLWCYVPCAHLPARLQPHHAEHCNAAQQRCTAWGGARPGVWWV